MLLFFPHLRQLACFLFVRFYNRFYTAPKRPPDLRLAVGCKNFEILYWQARCSVLWRQFTQMPMERSPHHAENRRHDHEYDADAHVPHVHALPRRFFWCASDRSLTAAPKLRFMFVPTKGSLLRGFPDFFVERSISMNTLAHILALTNTRNQRMRMCRM